MVTRRGLPREPKLLFTESMKVDRPTHDCAKYGHLFEKTETIWPEDAHLGTVRLTHTCTACGYLTGRV